MHLINWDQLSGYTKQFTLNEINLRFDFKTIKMLVYLSVSVFLEARFIELTKHIP